MKYSQLQAGDAAPQIDEYVFFVDELELDAGIVAAGREQ